MRDRTTGELRAAAWDEALDLVAERLRALRDAHGADAVAVFGGGGLTNEKAYQLGKFARVALGTSQIDYNGRFCMSSAAAAANRAFGVDRGLPFPLADLEQADVLVLRRQQPRRDHAAGGAPPRRLRAQRRALVVVDPRRTPTADRADVRSSSRCPAPTCRSRSACCTCSTEGRGRRGLPRGAHHRLGRGPPVASPGGGRSGSSAYRGAGLGTARAGADCSPVAARRSCSPRAAPSSTRRAPTRCSAWINLALAAGPARQAGRRLRLPHRPGQRPGRPRARAEGRPAARLPDDRRPGRARARGRACGGSTRRPCPAPGRSAYELLDALGTAGGPRALLVFGTNLVVSAPNATRVAERLAALDLLVVADFVPSETAVLADVVLPVTQWAEETGTMTNLEGRVIRRRKARRAARRACAATSR